MNINHGSFKTYLSLLMSVFLLLGALPSTAWGMKNDDLEVTEALETEAAESQNSESAGTETESAETERTETENTETADLEVLNDTKAFQKGEVTIAGVVYRCDENGEAAIINGEKATGDFVVPKEIIGTGNETYTVTRIEGYTQDNRYRGAFSNSKITGLSFAPDSQLNYIGESAFSSCYGLAGKSIRLPDTVTFIGSEAFYLFFNEVGIAEMRHPHRIKVSGTLPELTGNTPLDVPAEAAGYESTVDSSENITTLHKGASWTNADLSEAEIRIDYGKRPVINAKVDFVFVLDQSNSMLTATNASGEDGTTYTAPRTFFANDVVYGISQILLDYAPAGYDNRVALTAFGSSEDGKPLWSLDFTDSSAAAEEALFKNPLSLQNQTNYNAGLQGAIDLIKNRTDTSRTPVVVFLSDGKPSQGNYGVQQAQTLRDMGVKVYPLAVYTQPSSDLVNISYDMKTAYDASDTESFKNIIVEVMEEIVEQEEALAVSLEDVLSEHFKLATGTAADIIVSDGGGAVSTAGDRLIWDLTGCSLDQVHNLRIKVKLTTGTALTASGMLATNTALGAADGSISSIAQPQLARYLARYTFTNGSDPEQPLPPEVTALLPGTQGGFRDQSVVSPQAPGAAEVILGNGDKWVFDSWDEAEKQINSKDIEFIGVWRRAGALFEFIKTDAAGTGLAGARFELYRWQGTDAPEPADAYVTEENTISGKWQKSAAEPIESGSDGTVKLAFSEAGLYQLTEQQPPDGFLKPDVQWRFIINTDDGIDEIVTIKKNDNVVPITEILKSSESGQDIWRLKNYPQTDFIFIKISSQQGADGSGEAIVLDGAEFELYIWSGNQEPETNGLVTPELIGPGGWQPVGSTVSKDGGKVSFTIAADENFIYQLVETKAPKQYNLPQGQWRIRFHQDGTVRQVQTIPGKNGNIPPALELMSEGVFVGEMVLANVPIYKLPAMGGAGRSMYLRSGLLLIAAGLLFQWLIGRFGRKSRQTGST